MRVGILGGTGPLGRGLALRLATAGFDVSVGSRDPQRAIDTVEDLCSKWPRHALSIEGRANAVAAEGEIVVSATPWEAAVPTAIELSERLAGKVVVSVGNALVRQGREMLALAPPRSSVAAAVQAAIPDSMVVAACHHLPAASLQDLDEQMETDVLVCSDHPEATSAAMAMLQSVDGIRPLDAGSLAAAGAIEAFTAVLVTLNLRYKGHSTLRLAGLDGAGPRSNRGGGRV